MSNIIENVQETAYFLGVDGGGSKTIAILVDEQGRERGRGLAGSSNYSSVGLEQALFHLRRSVEEAAASAGSSLPVRAAWFGLAGMDRQDDHETLYPHLKPFAQQVQLMNDAELLLGALEDAVGVALIAGTGSIALGRDASGATARAGGWGYVLGDEGSGYDFGRQALQAATRAADGRGQPTLLLDLILQQWDLRHATDLIGQVYPFPDTIRIARLSSLVFAASRQGDQPASEIIQRAADELARAVLVIGEKLTFPDARIPLALGGGILLHEAVLRDAVLKRISQQHNLGQVELVEHPALSAARAAIRLM